MFRYLDQEAYVKKICAVSGKGFWFRLFYERKAGVVKKNYSKHAILKKKKKKCCDNLCCHNTDLHV